MRYSLKNGRWINISDEELAHNMDALKISYHEALELWLSDHDYEINAEQQELDEKAKKIKINHGAGDLNKPKKSSKPRVSKVSDEKKALFECILTNLDRCVGDDFEILRKNIQILTENKLIQVKIGEKTFKIDIIETRKPKD